MLIFLKDLLLFHCTSFSHSWGFPPFFTLYAEVTLNSELKSGLYMLYEWGKRELARYQHSDQYAQNPQGAIHKV